MKLVVSTAAILIAASTAMADSVSFNVEGYYSMNGYGDAANESLSLNLGAGAVVTGITWTDLAGVGIDSDGTTGGPSWGNEMKMLFGTADVGAVALTPFPSEGSGSAGGPWGPSSGSADLVDAGLDFAADVLVVTFYEGYNDHDGADALWTGGTVTIEYAIPAPGAIAMLGLAGVLGGRRRRA